MCFVFVESEGDDDDEAILTIRIPLEEGERRGQRLE